VLLTVQFYPSPVGAGDSLEGIAERHERPHDLTATTHEKGIR
jgi:hypothetical protein